MTALLFEASVNTSVSLVCCCNTRTSTSVLCSLSSRCNSLICLQCVVVVVSALTRIPKTVLRLRLLVFCLLSHIVYLRLLRFQLLLLALDLRLQLANDFCASMLVCNRQHNYQPSYLSSCSRFSRSFSFNASTSARRFLQSACSTLISYVKCT